MFGYIDKNKVLRKYLTAKKKNNSGIYIILNKFVLH